ncbi:hypothetical protein [Desulfurobacterium indicum]|uniref:Uncharacterized protein n=1 Tax=Desulfurobacterium indicum TaxID=1914305 RepID=A0A1R1MK67_9BACT|nr:hypothetical protein [Desulfurobacterium indicum]OMH40208.1 hypothetical protein BLW93_06260 [Desulfurobacterium indicum]
MVTVLHFEDRELAFALDSGKEGEGVDFSGEFGDNIYDDNGVICFYNYAFRSLNGEGDVFRELKGLIEDVELFENQIKGLYTVPELGVENATFKEVLEAVKRYYEEKLSSKQPTKTTA